MRSRSLDKGLPDRGWLVRGHRSTEWCPRCSTSTPARYGKRMDDWLRSMEDWNISRRPYYGLPLPFYPCACERCGHHVRRRHALADEVLAREIKLGDELEIAKA